mgnify:FL=1
MPLSAFFILFYKNMKSAVCNQKNDVKIIGFCKN